MDYIFETARLGLRKFALSDSKFIIELLNSPGWLQFIGDRNVRTEEQAVIYLNNGPINSYRENGFGLSMVEIKENKAAIGMCGILKRESLENPDIGFAFLSQYMGKGYAFEIANATLSYAKNTLAIPKISAITVAGNAKSIRLLEKLGLTFSKKFYFPGSDEELLLYNGTI